MQVASLVAEGGLKSSQAQKELLLRNQGLLRFVEQDYKGFPLTLHMLHTVHSNIFRNALSTLMSDCVFRCMHESLLQWCLALHFDMRSTHKGSMHCEAIRCSSPLQAVCLHP